MYKQLGALAFSGKTPLCPKCGEGLSGDKHPCFTESGFIYRTRACNACQSTIFTKQTQEEITGIETIAAHAG